MLYSHKTYKSLLLEFYASHGISAQELKFDVRQDFRPGSDFTCKLTFPRIFEVQGQDVFGSGRSKKDAEHLAAKAALVIFAEKGYIPARGLLDQQTGPSVPPAVSAVAYKAAEYTSTPTTKFPQPTAAQPSSLFRPLPSPLSVSSPSQPSSLQSHSSVQPPTTTASSSQGSGSSAQTPMSSFPQPFGSGRQSSADRPAQQRERREWKDFPQPKPRVPDSQNTEARDKADLGEGLPQSQSGGQAGLSQDPKNSTVDHSAQNAAQPDPGALASGHLSQAQTGSQPADAVENAVASGGAAELRVGDFAADLSLSEEAIGNLNLKDAQACLSKANEEIAELKRQNAQLKQSLKEVNQINRTAAAVLLRRKDLEGNLQ